ncbi:flavin containing amine oxidase like [Lecanosticta acicola]|uniref:Flavin containing amine oxidase like n=1 Tax=Lecanosticta acicola TaxID=111012 RepID=A0AAI8Z1A1_9PEZI|nr:flavin containing amine oxidase like [Lecanosticta acicola]
MERTEHVGYTDATGLSRMKKDLQSRPADGASNSNSDMVRTATAKSRQITIGIVGAGFAGLRCADLLLQAGCKVTILEARNRLGGRVAQSAHLGHLVDLGPNWIHGTDDNPIMDIAKQTGTKLHAWDEDCVIFDSEGQALSKEEADEYGSILWDDGLIADAFRYSNEHHDTIDPQRSLYDFFVERSKDLFESEPVEVAKQKREKLLQFTWMWSCYIGSPVDRQSLKFFWLEECIEGENPFVAGTYVDILQAVADPAKKAADIMLNTEVVEISSTGNGATNDYYSGQPHGSNPRTRPSVRTAQGQVLSFDEIVVTTPLGWLKRNKAAFHPELPPRLSSAIDNISYGQLDKVYITFPSAFWDTPTASTPDPPPHGIDPAGTTPNVTAKTFPLHQPPPSNNNNEDDNPSSSSSSSSKSPGFIHWLQPTYARTTNPRQWMQELVNFSALTPASCAHPTLLFYIHGPQSEAIGSLLLQPDEEDSDSSDSKLKQFFEPYYSLLPNYSRANPACTPRAVLATGWAVDTFAGYGSYANFQVGLQRGDEDVAVMREGLPERGVWLAGEHTAPFVALGTSTGAYWSGEAVGRRIVEAYGLKGGSCLTDL